MFAKEILVVSKDINSMKDKRYVMIEQIGNKTKNNKTFSNAKRNKQDEFYTKRTDIEKELKHYKEHFKGKVVFCNCDDPLESEFWNYFKLNFEHIGLKKLITTHYDYENTTHKIEYDGKDVKIKKLLGNGDFRSPECIELLKESDIVVTNPPFSLFREYVAQLIAYNKKFVIIGSLNAITYDEIFPLLLKNKIWVGYNNGHMEFRVPDYYESKENGYREENGIKYRSLGNIYWYTNIETIKRHEDLICYKKYNEIDYQKYENYNAINVDKIKNIPVDYFGEIGVPITFMDKYNPEQFEIVGMDKDLVKKLTGKSSRFYMNGKQLYARIIIKRRVK